MSGILQKSERRREQNRRAQANLRRKQQERIEDLQQQILSLKAQTQNQTGEQPPGQSVGHEDSAENPDLYNSYGDFHVDTGDLRGYLIEEDLLTNNLPVPTCDPFLSYVHQLPTPSYPSSSAPKSPLVTEPCRQVAEKTPQNVATTFQEYHCAFDALSKNASLLGISPESFLSTDSNSIFYSPLQSLTSISASIKHLPSEFHPTMAQLSYPHQPWIDCIPLQDLRSRIIFAVSHRPPFVDSLDVWHDVLSDGLSCAADPADALMWSMSDEFMQRWQMLLSIDLTTLETMCLSSNPPVRRISLHDS